MSIWVFLAAVFGTAILAAILLIERRIRIDLKVVDERILARGGELPRWRRPIEKREVLAGTHDLTCTLLFVLTYFTAPYFGWKGFGAAVLVYVITNALLFALSRNFSQGMLLVPWVSRLTIVVMGSLALLLDDGTLIKINRSLYFGVLSIWSLASVWIGRPRLARFGSRPNHQKITAQGWRAATIFAGSACAILAFLNELVWRNSSTSFWVIFQAWGWIVAELLLLPMAMPIFKKHGYSYEPSKAGRKANGA